MILLKKNFLLYERSSEVWKSLFFVLVFLFFWSLFSNLQISLVWSTFLPIMDSLLMMIFFPDFFLDFSRYFRIFIKSSDFFTEWIVSFSHMIWWFSLWKIHPVSGFFPDFSGSSSSLKICLLFLSLLCSRSRTLRI